MTEQERNAARERIATACLAAMLSGLDHFAPGISGRDLAEAACDYADSLLGALERRQ